MDCVESTRSYVPRAEPSLNFLYNYNNSYRGMEARQGGLGETPQGLVEAMEEMKFGNRERKKRLTSNQIESLERSFQEEIKLDTDRKMKLSRELGLQPRQIAVWFQNRRTRWKAKQLEHLYHALRQEYDHVYEEKQKLQEEVIRLKARLREQAIRTQISAGYTEMCETIEGSSEMLRGSNKPKGTINAQQIADGYWSFSVEDCNNVTVPLPPWVVVPY